MSEKLECNFFLVMNEDGEWEVGKERDDAAFGMDGQTRAIYFSVFVAPPEVEEIEVDVPDETTEVAEAKVEAA